MKKFTVKMLSLCMSGILVVGGFINFPIKGEASEVNAIQTEASEINKSEYRLVHEHTDENGFVHRIYEKYNEISLTTDSKTINHLYELSINNTMIATNLMETSWVYNGPVTDYPYLAYYKNNPIGYHNTNVEYRESFTNHISSSINSTQHESIFNVYYNGTYYEWKCIMNFYMDGNYATRSE